MKKLTVFSLLFCSLFVDAQRNTIYQPSYGLMQQAAGKKQAEYDYALKACNDFQQIQIYHLNSEVENSNVAEKQRYYNEYAANIQEAIKKDPMNAQAYLNQLNNVKIERANDLDIQKIETSFFERQKFFEDFKSLRISDPDKFLKMVKEADNKWSGNSLNGIWTAY